MIVLLAPLALLLYPALVAAGLWILINAGGREPSNDPHISAVERSMDNAQAALAHAGRRVMSKIRVNPGAQKHAP